MLRQFVQNKFVQEFVQNKFVQEFVHVSLLIFKIGYVHIGGIQVMIKAHFREGINSPVNLAILDKRIKD